MYSLLKQKISLQDPQVTEALKDLQYSYKRIAELKTIEDKNLQYQSISLIEFFELRIKNIETALWKAGVINFIRKPLTNSRSPIKIC